MDDYRDLFDILLEMEKAAEDQDRDRVIELNKTFSPAYNELAPRRYDPHSLPDYFDVARNKLINSIDNLVAPTAEDKQGELAEAKRLIGLIEKAL